MDSNIKTVKKINFFSQLEKKEIISQSNLANRVLISLGMVNALLKKTISKGFVKAKAAPYKRYIYYLTKDGFSEKARLVREYLESSLDFFNKAKKSYIEIFMEIKKKKKKEIFLVGSGDLVDICKLAAIESDCKINGHLRPGESFQLLLRNSKLNKNKKRNIKKIFIIVESKSPQLVFDLVYESFTECKIYHPKFLHISIVNIKI